MTVKRHKDTSLPERQIATALIVSDAYITTIRPIIDTSLLQSKFVRYVANWCLEYFDKYEKAPQAIIQDIYNDRKKALDETTAKATEIFLSSISDEYDRNESFNYQYVLDQTEKYLQLRKLKSLADHVNSAIIGDDLVEAENSVVKFNQIRLPQSNGVDLFRDLDRIKEIVETSDKQVVFRFKGLLGQILNDNCRGELLAFSGPEKRGKSWWLQEIGMIAVLDGFNVAHFSLEMSESQMVIRQLQYLTGQPVDKRDVGCTIPYLTTNGRFRTKKSSKPLLDARKAIKRLKALWPMTKGARLKLICWPPSTKSIVDIKAQLDIWERYDHFIPDLIVVDHADRMVAKEMRQDKRHQIDSVWEDLKSLALERHCLVATATHTTKAAHSKNITKETATAEDKRKAGHVDRMIALNQTDDEKADFKMRLSCVFERNANARGEIEVTVLQQLAIGKPYLGSYIEKKDKKDEEEED